MPLFLLSSYTRSLVAHSVTRCALGHSLYALPLVYTLCRLPLFPCAASDQIVYAEQIVRRHTELSAQFRDLFDVRLVSLFFPAAYRAEIHLQYGCKLLLGEILLLAELAYSSAVHHLNSNCEENFVDILVLLEFIRFAGICPNIPAARRGAKEECRRGGRGGDGG